MICVSSTSAKIGIERFFQNANGNVIHLVIAVRRDARIVDQDIEFSEPAGNVGLSPGKRTRIVQIDGDESDVALFFFCQHGDRRFAFRTIACAEQDMATPAHELAADFVSDSFVAACYQCDSRFVHVVSFQVFGEIFRDPEVFTGNIGEHAGIQARNGIFGKIP
ncbi:hypothetical protein NB636_03735 [Oxalobacter aliiformigenes]|nr:hypothetical protein [Oxalobacter aliiformigenes]MCZ4064737.1 hypothetical protein [Oxalobacter aliiformigenes]WAV99967.1 hypothetical protein NB636_03735 [Oxalobacter aliiformigenes]